MPTVVRVRITGGPWPERVGCEGVQCLPAADGTYPHPSRSEVIVLLDADPLGEGRWSWSCCLSRRDVEWLESSTRKTG